MSNNSQRAQNAQNVIMAYNGNGGQEPLDDQTTDLLADMMHLLGADKFKALVDRAEGHAGEEVRGNDDPEFPTYCFTVCITRDVSESHVLQIWAADAGEAEELALAKKEEADNTGEPLEFKTDETNEYRPYISWAEKDEERGVRYVK